MISVGSRPKHEIARDHFTLAREDIDDENERQAVSALSAR